MVTEIAEQASKILGPLSGLATTWALDLGLRLGLFEHLAGQPDGAAAEEVAAALDLDPLYTKVVLRAAYAGEVLDQEHGRYRLAEHMGTLLLDPDSPAYAAGAVRTFVALRETFLDLRQLARTGEREWWDDFDPEWIEAVGDNGQTYYRRILSAVVPKLAPVRSALERGARYLDLACGICRGPAKVVAAFPRTRVTAVDCDRYSLATAERQMKERGIDNRFTFVHSFLEDPRPRRRLRPRDHQHQPARGARHRAYGRPRAPGADEGEAFLVSEFPFPEHDEDTRSLPGRLMCGVQAFEAHIGCQLLPTRRYVELLEAVGFRDVGSIDVTPTQPTSSSTGRNDGGQPPEGGRS